MPVTMDRHDAIVDDVLSAHDGSIADHTGDGVFALLDDAAAGLAAAVDLQLRLAAEEWPHGGRLLVRCGVHTGPVIVRGERLSGAEIHRAARIMQAAGGGQILVSEAVKDAAQDDLAGPIGFRPVGSITLRGLRHTERIFEVTHPELLHVDLPAAQRRPGPGRTAVTVVERDVELAELEARWGSAQVGAGSVVVVAGEPGIGKSTLIRAFLDRLDGVSVLRGACDDLATPRTFGAIRDLALDASGPLRSVAFDDRDAVFSALLEEVRRTPSVVVIEDLQWADDATLDAVQLLAHRVDALPLLLVTSTRPTGPDRRSVFEATSGSVARVSLVLEPLTLPGVTEVASGTGLSPRRLLRLTGGNPFFLTELLAAPSEIVPTSIREAVIARLRQLPAETQAALDLLAVIPGTVDGWLVDLLLEDTAVLVPAEVSAVVSADTGGVTFRHELARQAVYEAMPFDRRRRLHQSVGRALEGANADHAVIVHHALAARDSAMVMRHVEQAIREAVESGSYSQALDLVDALDEHLQPEHEHLRGWAALQRAAALSALDRGDAALAAGRRAVAILQSQGADLTLAEAHRTLSRIAWWLRDFETARTSATAALGVLEGLDNDEHSAVVRAQVAHLMALSRDPRAIRAAQRALELATESGSERAAASAEVALGLAGDAAHLRSHLERAIAKARAVGDVETETRATTNLASSFTHGHHYDEAERWLPIAEELSRRHEQLAALSIASGLKSWLRALRGDLTGSLPEFDRFIVELENEDQRAWGLLHKAVVLARLGSFAEAAELIERAQGSRAGRSADPELVFEAARVEAWWLAGWDLDGDRIINDVLWPNRHDRPEDYAGRLARNLARAGFHVPRFDMPVAGYAAAIWGDAKSAAAVWEQVGNPYERGVELSLAGEEGGRAILESIGAAGAVGRIFGQ